MGLLFAIGPVLKLVEPYISSQMESVGQRIFLLLNFTTDFQTFRLSVVWGKECIFATEGSVTTAVVYSLYIVMPSSVFRNGHINNISQNIIKDHLNSGVISTTFGCRT